MKNFIGRAVLVALLVVALAALGCKSQEQHKSAGKDAPEQKNVVAKEHKQGEAQKESTAKAPAPVPKEEEGKNVTEPRVMNVAGMKSLPLAEIQEKAERFAEVKITYDDSKLDPARKKMLEHLLNAADILDGLFWAQSTPDGRKLFDELSKDRKRFDELSKDKSRAAKLLRRYVHINYGRYGRLDGGEPFIGEGEKPRGATYYPADMAKEEFENWLEAHPADQEAFTDEFTIIRRSKEGGLIAIPYNEFYKKELDDAASELRAAAALAENATLKRYLESRAAAFQSNDYYASDVDWMDLEGNLIEVTIGPYEVYEDRIFNYKAAFEAFITLNDPEAAAELSKVAGYLPQMEINLPIPDEHKNHARGSESPIRVVDVIYTAGDTRAGVQTLAFNLPNDERVREAKGSKKVLLRNVSDAKFDKILTPIAEHVLTKDQLPLLARENYFNHTLMHEMSHGLGPGNITLADGTETSVNRELKELYSTIEEAKADTLGIYNTFFLIDQGVFPKEWEARTAVTTLAGTFRSVRFGAEEAHGKANMIIFNYLLKNGAYVHDPTTGQFSVELSKVRQVVKDLAHEILMVQAMGDYDACKKLIDTYGEMPECMKAAIAGLTDVPVDIEPIYAVEPR